MKKKIITILLTIITAMPMSAFAEDFYATCSFCYNKILFLSDS